MTQRLGSKWNKLKCASGQVWGEEIALIWLETSFFHSAEATNKVHQIEQTIRVGSSNRNEFNCTVWTANLSISMSQLEFVASIGFNPAACVYVQSKAIHTQVFEDEPEVFNLIARIGRCLIAKDGPKSKANNIGQATRKILVNCKRTRQHTWSLNLIERNSSSLEHSRGQLCDQFQRWRMSTASWKNLIIISDHRDFLPMFEIASAAPLAWRMFILQLEWAESFSQLWWDGHEDDDER